MRKLSFIFVTSLVCLFFTTTTFASADIRVENHTGKPVWAVWKAWGCFGVVYYDIWSIDRVCDHKVIYSESWNDYNFKWGTSGREVYVFGGGNSKKDIWCYHKYNVSGSNPIVLNKGWCTGQTGHTTREHSLRLS